MFKTEEVETYLQDAYPEVDGDKRVLKLRCYVNPISYELTKQVDPEIAAILFHKVGSEWMPRPMLNHCRLSKNVPAHSLTFCRDPLHANSRTLIPAVGISKLEAGKVIPESNDFALMFTVTFDIHDKAVLGDMSDLLHEKFYLTFAKLQPGLFDGKDPVMDSRAGFARHPIRNTPLPMASLHTATNTPRTFRKGKRCAGSAILHKRMRLSRKCVRKSGRHQGRAVIRLEFQKSAARVRPAARGDDETTS